VSAGEPGAFFGVTELGPLTLKWRCQAGQSGAGSLVEGKAVRVALDKE